MRKQIGDSTVESSIAIPGKDINFTNSKQQKTQQTLHFRSQCTN